MGLTHSRSLLQRWRARSAGQDSALWENSMLKLDIAVPHVSRASLSGSGSIKHQPG